MIISMLILPITGLVVIGSIIYLVITGDWVFILVMFGLFTVLQTLMSALAVRIDRDDPRLILFSPFLVIGYKQIVDILLVKAVIEETLGLKAKWTRAMRVGV
jgi:hypothetical protein